jgi:hypothetical protein
MQAWKVWINMTTQPTLQNVDEQVRILLIELADVVPVDIMTA